MKQTFVFYKEDKTNNDKIAFKEAFIFIFVHDSSPFVLWYYIFLFLSSQFLNNCAEISRISKEL